MTKLMYELKVRSFVPGLLAVLLEAHEFVRIWRRDAESEQNGPALLVGASPRLWATHEADQLQALERELQRWRSELDGPLREFAAPPDRSLVVHRAELTRQGATELHALLKKLQSYSDTDVNRCGELLAHRSRRQAVLRLRSNLLGFTRVVENELRRYPEEVWSLPPQRTRLQDLLVPPSPEPPFDDTWRFYS